MVIAYLFIFLGLAIYSYSQIDLNLTLFQNHTFLQFQSFMIRLGYFNRPLSTLVFLTILGVLSLLYFSAYKHFSKAEPGKKKLLWLTGGVIILAALSYPAFSHDIFNYIFDARIIGFHHQDPYVSTALMFPHDDWTRFMNWTHRTYPYGPTFLPISLLFYFLGMGKFILTLLSFKVLMLLSYLGSSYLIWKQSGWKGLAFFALNPLILLEVIVSGHMDIIMLFFALLATSLSLSGQKVTSIISLIVSVGVKYATILLAPALYLPKISQENRLKLLVVLAFIGALAQVGFRELLPHYLIVPIGISALIPKNNKWFYLIGGISILVLVLRYTPYLFTGIWSPIVFPSV